MAQRRKAIRSEEFSNSAVAPWVARWETMTSQPAAASISSGVVRFRPRRVAADLAQRLQIGQGAAVVGVQVLGVMGEKDPDHCVTDRILEETAGRRRG